MAKKKARRRAGLDRIAEQFAISLIHEASGGTIGKGSTPSKEGEEDKENPISFRDRRALLDSITKLLSGQKDPLDGEEEDGIADFRERLNERSGEDERGADTGETETDIRGNSDEI